MITSIELDSSLKKARKLAAQKKYKKSLQKYLFVFDNSRAVSGYSGVRLSYVPSEIASIGKSYPIAIRELRKRRNLLNLAILKGKAGFDQIHELQSLNYYLKNTHKTVALYDKICRDKKKNPKLIEDFRHLIWDELLEAKRYDDLGKDVDRVARTVAERIGEYFASVDFPIYDYDSPTYQNWAIKKILKEGKQAHKVLTTIGRKKTAKKLQKWVKYFKKSVHA